MMLYDLICMGLWLFVALAIALFVLAGRDTEPPVAPPNPDTRDLDEITVWYDPTVY
jgi:hypothetical protein